MPLSEVSVRSGDLPQGSSDVPSKRTSPICMRSGPVVKGTACVRADTAPACLVHWCGGGPELAHDDCWAAPHEPHVSGDIGGGGLASV